MAARTAQEEGFHGYKDRGEVDLGAGALIQDAGVGQPVEERIGSKVGEQ